MKTVRAMGAAILVSVLTTTAALVAGNGGPQGTQGWLYGLHNCGCAGAASPTRQSCRNCCSGSAMAAKEVLNCIAYCDQSVFPCQPTCPWWNPFC